MAGPKELCCTRMAEIGSAEALCEIARPLIQFKARRLGCCPGFSRSDIEDIEQEAYLRLLQRFHAGNCCECPVLVFIKTIVNQCVASLIRDRFRQKRDSRRTRSLNAPCDRTGTELGDAISDAQSGCDDCCHRAHTDLSDLGMDVDATIAELTFEQQQLCKVLGINSISELARRFEMPRTTLSDRVRKVRRNFEDRGLRDYVT